MGGQSALCHFVHALGADLYLHPAALGTHDGDVEAFVAVGFGHREPVSEAFGVGAVHVGDNAEDLPAVLFLALRGAVQDDAYGEEVVDALELALLLLHLLPDGVYGLGAALHVEVEASLLESLLDGADEGVDVAVACSACLRELILYHVEDVGLEVLQAEVLQFALDEVEAQLVGQGGVEHAGLLCHALALLQGAALLDLAHEADAAGDDDEDDAHVLGKGEEQVAEVLRLDAGVLLIDFLHAQEAVDDMLHVGTEVALHLLLRDGSQADAVVEQDGQQAGAVQAYFLGQDDGCLQVEQDGVQAEGVTLQGAVLGSCLEDLAEARQVVGQDDVGSQPLQAVHGLAQLGALCVGEGVEGFHCDVCLGFVLVLCGGVCCSSLWYSDKGDSVVPGLRQRGVARVTTGCRGCGNGVPGLRQRGAAGAALAY